MSELEHTVNKMKQKYREIFMKSSDAIKARVEGIRPMGFEGDIFDKFEVNSIGAKWQAATIEMFEKDISKEIYRKWQEILKFRENFECKGCATCCNLACSEFSPEELKKRAKMVINSQNSLHRFLYHTSHGKRRRKYIPNILICLMNQLMSLFIFTIVRN